MISRLHRDLKSKNDFKIVVLSTKRFRFLKKIFSRNTSPLSPLLHDKIVDKIYWNIFSLRATVPDDIPHRYWNKSIGKPIGTRERREFYT
jgi:hypothetical protein